MKRDAFTLMELLIVITILTFVAAAIFGTIRSGIKIWKRADGINKHEDVWIFTEKMKNDLGRAVIFDDIEWRGESQAFSFPAITNKPFRRMRYKDTNIFLDQITRVRYGYDRYKKAIYRECSDYMEYSAKRTPDREIIVNDIYTFKMTYYAYSEEGKIKKSTLLERGIVPDFVELKLSFNSESGRKKEITEIMEVVVGRLQ